MSRTASGIAPDSAMVVVVDHTGSLYRFARKSLAPQGVRVRRCETAEAGAEALEGGRVAAALIDACVPHRSLLEGAEAVIRAGGGTPSVVVTGCPLMDAAARVLYPEAAGFLQKPCSPERLLDALRRAMAGNRGPAGDACPERPFHGIVGASDGIRGVIERIRAVAPTDSTVLITGETGTGKELVARAIHECSARSEGPYVVVDALSLSESLLESELFGHERGAFTGATGRREGLFEAADGGTIFLDEIGDIPPPVQVRLLRAIQEQEVRPVGSVKPRKVDVRVVAATQRPLKEAVSEGRMRADLYYRLSVYNIGIPPLRKRPEDVPVLVDHFLRDRGPDLGGVKRCGELALRILESYGWPGNVRELLAVLEAAVIEARDEQLDATDLPEMLRVEWREKALAGDGDLEGGVIRAALRETCGHRAEAADLLGVSRTTLWRRMKKSGL